MRWLSFIPARFAFTPVKQHGFFPDAYRYVWWSPLRPNCIGISTGKGRSAATPSRDFSEADHPSSARLSYTVQMEHPKKKGGKKDDQNPAQNTTAVLLLADQTRMKPYRNDQFVSLFFTNKNNPTARSKAPKGEGEPTGTRGKTEKKTGSPVRETGVTLTLASLPAFRRL